MIVTQKLLKLKKKCFIIIAININTLTADNFVAGLAQANLATKADTADFVKGTYFDNELKDIDKNKTLQIKQNMDWVKMS